MAWPLSVLPGESICSDGLAERIVAKGGKALAVSMDVTDRASVKAGFDLAEQAFGTPDIIVCQRRCHGAVSPF